MHHTHILPLNHLELIKISGADAETFLQNQFSNDITLLKNNSSQLSSYSSAKGMLFSNFRIVRIEDAFLLLIPSDIIGLVAKRLSMFVLRDDVNIETETLYSVAGIISNDLKELETSIECSLPNSVNELSTNADIHFIRCHDDNETKRYIAIGQNDALNKFIEPSTDATTQASTENEWLKRQILAGEAIINKSSYEQFVGQMLNLDLLEAINFKKGCYPGQEYIARTQYRGQVRSRLYILELDSNEFLDGMDLFVKDKAESDPIGKVINAAGNLALAVIRNKQVDNGSEIIIKEFPDTPIKISHTPYFDKAQTADA